MLASNPDRGSLTGYFLKYSSHVLLFFLFFFQVNARHPVRLTVASQPRRPWRHMHKIVCNLNLVDYGLV